MLSKVESIIENLSKQKSLNLPLSPTSGKIKVQNDEILEWERNSQLKLKIILVEDEEKKNSEPPVKNVTSLKVSSNSQSQGALIQSVKISTSKKTSVFNYTERKISVSSYNSKPSNEVLGSI